MPNKITDIIKKIEVELVHKDNVGYVSQPVIQE